MLLKEIVKYSGKTQLIAAGLIASGFSNFVLIARLRQAEERWMSSHLEMLTYLASSIAACGLACSFIFSPESRSCFHSKALFAHPVFSIVTVPCGNKLILFPPD
ncbi:hypothetical protein PQR62_09775 [Herbaspirillum lusitanum]|uniref:Uncharacterized protein n=1 Tax=Herbaspirillum lusitanum TaxID=213312 RepID=A0ABW9A9B0_9BURK